MPQREFPTEQKTQDKIQLSSLMRGKPQEYAHKCGLGGMTMNIKIIRENDCRALTGLSRTTRWRLEKNGTFPARRQVSPGTVGWIQSEIEEWVKNRTVVG